MKRRTFVGLGIAAAAGCTRRSATPSPVAIVRAPSYERGLTDAVRRAVELCGVDAGGKNVLLKPNFVEFAHSKAINTHPAMVAAAVEVFESMGAASVRIGEGPGHRRDTWGLAEEAGYLSEVPDFEQRFTDLNRDEVSRVDTFADLPYIYLPNTALAADLIVSLAKMKTHHWMGATLSMKNFFGVVPGAVYGWPKNQLHHSGIERSIVELNRIFRNTFALIDGVVGMEGDGPIKGTAKEVGVVVAGADVAAVDATCCRIMGIDPAKVGYLKAAPPAEQRGERVEDVHTPFALIPQWQHLRLA